MSNIYIKIDSAQYLTSSAGPSLRHIAGTISLTYSYARVRGSADTILLKGTQSTGSAMVFEGASSTGATADTSSAATSSLFRSFFVGTCSATYSGSTGIGGGTNSHGPLIAGNYPLTLSFASHGNVSPGYILTVS